MSPDEPSHHSDSDEATTGGDAPTSTTAATATADDQPDATPTAADTTDHPQPEEDTAAALFEDSTTDTEDDGHDAADSADAADASTTTSTPDSESAEPEGATTSAIDAQYAWTPDPEELDEPVDDFYLTEDGQRTLVGPEDLRWTVPELQADHIEEIDRYWLDKPNSFCIILHSRNKNERLYYVVEPVLSEWEYKLKEFFDEQLRANMDFESLAIDDAGALDWQRQELILDTFYNLLNRYSMIRDQRVESESLPTRALKWLADLLKSRAKSRRQESQNLVSPPHPENYDTEGPTGPPADEDSPDHRLTPKQIDKIAYYLIRDFIGWDKIEPIKHDRTVEDINCDGPMVDVFIDHNEYEQLITNIRFTEDELDRFVEKMANRAGKGISRRQPIVDATLPNGSRASLTLGDETTTGGSAFTIRMFREVPFTPVDLIAWNTYDLDQMAYLWLCIENGKSFIFAGGTSSGKTTTQNALSLFIPGAKQKIVSIEDTPELNLPQKNWVQRQTREAFTKDGSDAIEEMDLMRRALRENPDYIVVGEVRGEEGSVMFQAMSSGHACFTTFHANDPGQVIKRFTSSDIGVSREFFNELDGIVNQEQVRVDGRKVRRNTQITEIGAYDEDTNTVEREPIFEWDAHSDEFIQTNPSSLLDEIRKRRGWSMARLEWELLKRQTVLAYLLKNDITRYKHVASAIQATLSEEVDILKSISRGTLESRLDELAKMRSVEFNVTDEQEESVPRPDISADVKLEAKQVLTDARPFLDQLVERAAGEHTVSADPGEATAAADFIPKVNTADLDERLADTHAVNIEWGASDADAAIPTGQAPRDATTSATTAADKTGSEPAEAAAEATTTTGDATSAPGGRSANGDRSAAEATSGDDPSETLLGGNGDGDDGGFQFEMDSKPGTLEPDGADTNGEDATDTDAADESDEPDESDEAAGDDSPGDDEAVGDDGTGTTEAVDDEPSGRFELQSGGDGASEDTGDEDSDPSRLSDWPEVATLDDHEFGDGDLLSSDGDDTGAGESTERTTAGGSGGAKEPGMEAVPGVDDADLEAATSDDATSEGAPAQDDGQEAAGNDPADSSAPSSSPAAVEADPATDAAGEGSADGREPGIESGPAEDGETPADTEGDVGRQTTDSTAAGSTEAAAEGGTQPGDKPAPTEAPTDLDDGATGSSSPSSTDAAASESAGPMDAPSTTEDGSAEAASGEAGSPDDTAAERTEPAAGIGSGEDTEPTDRDRASEQSPTPAADTDTEAADAADGEGGPDRESSAGASEAAASAGQQSPGDGEPAPADDGRDGQPRTSPAGGRTAERGPVDPMASTEQQVINGDSAADDTSEDEERTDASAPAPATDTTDTSASVDQSGASGSAAADSAATDTDQASDDQPATEPTDEEDSPAEPAAGGETDAIDDGTNDATDEPADDGAGESDLELADIVANIPSEADEGGEDDDGDADDAAGGSGDTTGGE